MHMRTIPPTVAPPTVVNVLSEPLVTVPEHGTALPATMHMVTYPGTVAPPGVTKEFCASAGEIMNASARIVLISLQP